MLRETEFLILSISAHSKGATLFILGSPLFPLILDMPISFIHQDFSEQLYQALWLRVREDGRASQLNLER